jgi:hypothetical protein
MLIRRRMAWSVRLASAKRVSWTRGTSEECSVVCGWTKNRSDAERDGVLPLRGIFTSIDYPIFFPRRWRAPCPSITPTTMSDHCGDLVPMRQADEADPQDGDDEMRLVERRAGSYDIRVVAASATSSVFGDAAPASRLIIPGVLSWRANRLLNHAKFSKREQRTWPRK